MGRRRVGGEATSVTATAPATVPVSSIAHNPRNPRDDYDDVDELAASMGEVGVLQPLGIVRHEVWLARHPEHEPEVGAAHWVVVQGNRRLAAARRAELTEVPVIVHERLGRQDRFDESTLIENVHRTDLPPLREAALLQELVDKHGSQRQTAKAVGKTSGWVTQRLSLLKLVPQLQAKLSTAELSIAAARDLAQLPQSRQLDAYDNGAPYRDPSKPQPGPAPGVDLANRDTYTRTEVPPEGAYDVSTPVTTEAGSNNGHSRSGRDHADGELSAYDVSTLPGAAAAQFSENYERTLPAKPADLVAALEREYTADQLAEVLRLLQQ